MVSNHFLCFHLSEAGSWAGPGLLCSCPREEGLEGQLVTGVSDVGVLSFPPPWGPWSRNEEGKTQALGKT